VPALVEKLHTDSDSLLEGAMVALVRIGHPLAAHLIRDAWAGAEWDFRNFAGGVLGDLKHPDCE
jgi:hypothetical protein